MKTIILAAAAGLAAAAIAPAAGAQVHRETRTVTTRTVVRQHTGPAVRRTHRVCTVRYNHHRKVRTCRIVRY